VQIKRIVVPALIPAAFLLGTTVNTGIARQAQADPGVVQVAFMKVDPTKNAEYMALERDIWKPMHQDRIKQGTMRSWTVYSVRFPTGTKREYDYAVVNTYNSLADADRSMQDVAARIHPKIPIAELSRRTYAARDLVRGELWYKVDEAIR
jgi:L-rhamnose mutarotase